MFSGTRATVSSYRMQRESNVCESVCEARVLVVTLVHGCCRSCRACYLCVCAQCVCVCACVCARAHAKPLAESKGPIKSLSSSPHWTTRTQRMTYEWTDKDGVKHVTAWSKAVRNAMLQGGAEFHRQQALNLAACKWRKTFYTPRTVGSTESDRRQAQELEVTSCLT